MRAQADMKSKYYDRNVNFPFDFTTDLCNKIGWLIDILLLTS